MLDIVIPTLNEEHYIGKLLDCLASQTNKNFKVYLSDGNSKDKTIQVVESYKNKLNIEILKCDKAGVAHQRNIGVRAGNSDGILFLDADAIIAPNFIDKFTQSSKGKYLAICWVAADSKKTFDRVFSNIYNAVIIELSHKFFPAAAGCGLYTSRKLFEEINGFNESLKFWEDVDYVQRAVKNGYKLKFLRRLKVYVSTRRLDAEGRLKIILQLLKGTAHWVTKGTMPNEEDIYYPMDLQYAKLLKEKKVSENEIKKFITKYTRYLEILKNPNKKIIKKYLPLFNLKSLGKN